MLKERSWMQSLYLPPHIPADIKKKSEAQGGGDDRSLMGCIVLFLYLKRLKPLMILVERESQWCFNYSGPSINHGLCVWQLNPSKTNTGAPRPSQSTGWAQQPWSQHTRCTWTPLQSPAATRSATKAGKSQRRQQIPTLQEKNEFQDEADTETNEEEVLVFACVSVCQKRKTQLKLYLDHFCKIRLRVLPRSCHRFIMRSLLA